MPKNPLSGISLKKPDELFTTEEQRQEERGERICMLPLTELHVREDNPVSIQESDVTELGESIHEKGVHQPIIVRPREGGGYAAIAPVPLSSLAGEPTSHIGKAFLKSYAAVCLEGAVIVLACIIFSVFAASPPVVDAAASASTMVWSYVGELVFNLLVLVGAVKMADRVVKEMISG